MFPALDSLTIPITAFVCAGITLAVSVLAPIGLAAFCFRKKRGMLHAVLVGALCFIVSALVLESLLHQLVFALFPTLTQQPLLYTLYGCLAAGLFEETARLIGLRRLCKRDASAMTGFSYGVGHGGIESILLTGMSMVNSLVVMATIRNGQAGELVASLPAEQQALGQSQLEQLAAMPALDYLAGSAERLAAIALHIALSLLIWMVVVGRLPKWGYAVSILLHALVNVPAALYQAGVLKGIWPTELLIILFTAGACLGVWQAYRRTEPHPAPNR